MRRKTRTVKIGNLKIGSGHPIRVQSMAKSDTRDVAAAVKEIRCLEAAGCEIARVAVKDTDAASAIRKIKRKIRIPLVADIHFNYNLALAAINAGADKIRINPGNMKNKEGLRQVIRLAKKRKIPIRIGLNSGSLGPGNKFIEEAVKGIKFFEGEGFRDIIISLKSSDVAETVASYRRLARLCDYPFHVGVTAAGAYDTSVIKSSIGIGSLLLDGIGDTIRVSLTGDAVDEVIVGRKILSSLGLRDFGPQVISCPICGRCQVNLVGIVRDLESKLSAIRPSTQLRAGYPPFDTAQGRLSAKHYPTIAIMGCEVNGPGEARLADIGIAFGKGTGILFKKGRIIKKVAAKNAVKELLRNI